MSANQSKPPPFSPVSLAIGWVGMLDQPITQFYFSFFSLPGETLKKKKHPQTLTSVVPLPEKMKSVTPVQTPEPLPVKVSLEDPSPARVHLVSVVAPMSL